MGKCISAEEHLNIIELPEVPANTTPKECVNFLAPIHSAKVIKVYDGDTFTIACYLTINGSEPVLYKFPCRINGIDAPELKPKKSAAHFKGLSEKEIERKMASEKELANIAANFLRETILGKIVMFSDHKKEKYGRVLATITMNNINIGELMLNKRYALPYDGKAKKIPHDWMIWYKTGKMEEQK